VWNFAPGIPIEVSNVEPSIFVAHLDALELRELVGVLVDELRKAPEERLPRCRQHFGPGSRLERPACSEHGSIDVGVVRVADRRDLSTGRGVVDRDALIGGRVDPFAAYEQARSPLEEAPHRGRGIGLCCNRGIHVHLSLTRVRLPMGGVTHPSNHCGARGAGSTRSGSTSSDVAAARAGYCACAASMASDTACASWNAVFAAGRPQ
jgi:hypothetical protein